MQDLFAGENGGQYLTAVLWTVGALVLLVLILFIVRLLRRASLSFAGGDHANRPRLGLGESIEIDKQRRLVIVRRDNVEHLILIGGPSDLVIEEGIGRGTAAAERQQRREEPVVAAPPRIVPAPPPPREPEPVRTDPALDTPHRPVESERPRPQAAAVAPAPRAVAADQAHTQPEPGSSVRQVASPSPVRPEVHARGPEEDEVVQFPRDETARGTIQAAPAPAPQGRQSLEDEMSRLLEDITDEKR